MKVITINMEELFLEAIQLLITQKTIDSRSEFIREALISFLDTTINDDNESDTHSFKIITAHLNDTIVKAVDERVKDNTLYESRSEFIRIACRDHLLRYFNLDIEDTKEVAEKIEDMPFKTKKLKNPNKTIITTHGKPNTFIRYTGDFSVDFLLSFINENPGISNEKLSELGNYKYRTTRMYLLKGKNKYGVPLKIKSVKNPNNKTHTWFYTLE